MSLADVNTLNPKSHRADLIDAGVSFASANDYLNLLKPRVMSLVVFTALAGLMAAPGTIHPILALVAIVCIGVGAGASGALNMWYDADLDTVMKRTQSRPIPSGSVRGNDALGFGLILSLLSVITLGTLINWAAGAFLAFTIFFYVVIYTMWLKRWTPQNIVIGGAAGAFPPAIGWIAVTGTLSLEPILMVGVIFLWTPPHFWALAILTADDYRAADVPMMPLVAGHDSTCRQITLYTVITSLFALLPVAFGFVGVAYALLAVFGGVLFVRSALALQNVSEPGDVRKAAGKMFGFSISYLFGLFAAILVEDIVRRAFGVAFDLPGWAAPLAGLGGMI